MIRNLYNVLFLELILRTNFFFCKFLFMFVSNFASLLLPIPDWSYLPLNFKGLTIFKKNKFILQKQVEFKFLKFETHFLKEYTFWSRNNFSLFMVICLRWYLNYCHLQIKWQEYYQVLYKRQKCCSIRKISNGFKIPFFSNSKHISQFIDKFLKFEEMEYLICHV